MENLNFNNLPVDCVSTIFSLTSPEDASRLSVVSSTIRSASESDIAWNNFLPHDYEEIITRSFNDLIFSSKKELFCQLSNSILIDGGNKSFALEKKSGRKLYVISARELSILHGDDPSHWTWKFIPESRFDEVVELKTVSNLDIKYTLQTQMLSPNTNYGAYLIIKISNNAFGLNAIPLEISLTIEDELVINNTTYLCKKDSNKNQVESLFYMNRMQMMKTRVNQGNEKLPSERVDGWLEIELGEFFTSEGNNKEVIMSLSEIKGHQLKGGLVIEGIEVRPK